VVALREVVGMARAAILLICLPGEGAAGQSRVTGPIMRRE